MDSRTRREGDSSISPSAKFLQARITALSAILIKRFENILAVALDETDQNGQPVPPVLTDTAMQQMQLDVDSTALVRAAEEIMVLTRSMKETWLFGGLKTIKSDEEKVWMAERERRLNEDTKIVREGMEEFLKGYPRARPKEGSQVAVYEGEG
jgi:Surfeit locus protein 5 subunit 22 of Mediator complex